MFQGRLKGDAREFSVGSWFFERSSKGILEKFHKCVKEDSRVFQESFYGGSRKFQGCFPQVSSVLNRVLSGDQE